MTAARTLKAQRRTEGVCTRCCVPLDDTRYARCDNCRAQERGLNERKAEARLLNACVVALRAWVQAGAQLDGLLVPPNGKVQKARLLTGICVDMGLLKHGRGKGEGE